MQKRMFARARETKLAILNHPRSVLVNVVRILLCLVSELPSLETIHVAAQIVAKIMTAYAFVRKGHQVMGRAL